eukprot:CAMPEP_0171882986 /NCGR_PEP_ID=MMETSP0992-20121227/39909_1 /TAXON_ID=483369 /ORGANISM="non described non described, Strain CCMP2098" /LENGTH=33 /DNA_ID= /DNA_START= /DNA_END= /DNA_ORIENTATION=
MRQAAQAGATRAETQDNVTTATAQQQQQAPRSP